MNPIREHLITILMIMKVYIFIQIFHKRDIEFMIYVLCLIDSSHYQQARERQLVFLPRKRNIVPKFNLLGLKPIEGFQPYRKGFFQPHGLG